MQSQPNIFGRRMTARRPVRENLLGDPHVHSSARGEKEGLPLPSRSDTPQRSADLISDVDLHPSFVHFCGFTRCHNTSTSRTTAKHCARYIATLRKMLLEPASAGYAQHAGSEEDEGWDADGIQVRA